VGRLDDSGAQGERFGDDGTDQDCERNPPPGAFNRVRVLPLVVSLVQRKEPADAEEHDRDDERVDVTVPAVTERMLRAGLPGGPFTADEKQNLVPGVGHGVYRFRQHRG
jgi:hypothetical protein